MPAEVLTQGQVTWTNVLHPNQEDMRVLSDRYPHFHPLNLQDCLTELEFPKINHYDDYLFLVLQFPVWKGDDQVPAIGEIDVFLASGVLVTSHQDEIKPLTDMFSRVCTEAAYRQEVMGQGASPLFYHLLNVLVDCSFPVVQRLDHRILKIEEKLFDESPRHILREIALVRRAVIALRRILHPQLEIVRTLARGNWPFIQESLDIYWGDVSDSLALLCAMLDEHAEVISGLSDTVDALASHRIDEVVRLLTVVTVLTLPLTLLATVFGMNIWMPYASHPLLFFIIVGVGLISTAAIIWFLIQRSWL
jgi:magnesium transporter